eukprot:g5965.t1
MSVLETFEKYQKARVDFVQKVAELASRPQNVSSLQDAGAMKLLRPLLLDVVPSIQQNAAAALGRLASHSEDLAEDIVANEILPQLVYSLSEQNRFYKRAAAFVLRSVAKHSPELALAVVDSGALEALVLCLEEFDPSVKEGAAWALGYIAQHNASLAQSVVDAGAVPNLVLCIQEAEISLKRISASALSDICKHSPELAQSVVDAGAVAYLAPLIQAKDPKLKRQVCACLAQIAKHSVDLAEVVVEAEIFPKILVCLKDIDQGLIVNAGGAAALVDYVKSSRGNGRLPGIMALGFISAFSETLALAIIVSKGVTPLKHALTNEKEDHIKAAAAWSLGQLGRHTPDHARALAEADVLRLLLDSMQQGDASDDLKTKSKRALKAIVSKCTKIEALDALLKSAPTSIQQHILNQFKNLLPNDVQARRNFVQSGGLQFIQELAENYPDDIGPLVEEINKSFPAEIVQYYSPGYSKQLLDKIGDLKETYADAK